MHAHRLISFILSVFLSPLGVLAQGLYWEQTVSVPGLGKGKEVRTKGYMMPMKLKSVSDAEGAGVIIRADKEMMYIVDDDEKTYSEMTFKEFEAQMEQMGAQMRKMQDELKDMPAEQRRMLEGMLGGMTKEKELQIKKTKEKKKILTYECEKILVYEGDSEVGEFWITKDLGSMKQFAKDWASLMEKMVQGPMTKMYRKIAELDGFAMESRFGGMRSTTTKLEKRSLDAGEFEVPAGYKKVETEKMEWGEDE